MVEIICDKNQLLLYLSDLLIEIFYLGIITWWRLKFYLELFTINKDFLQLLIFYYFFVYLSDILEAYLYGRYFLIFWVCYLYFFESSLGLFIFKVPDLF